LDLLILPGLAAMSDGQCQALQEFTAGGGSLILTGNTACLDEWGQARQNFPLAEVAGFTHLDVSKKFIGEEPSSWEEYQAHNYFRLSQEGEKERSRQPILQGFEKTDILPFGGTLWQVEAGAGMQILATYIHPFPIYPPEFSWMRTPQTDIPAILAGATQGGGRMVYFAGDIDRCYGRAHLPDHGDLLANAIRWAAREPPCLQVDGPGYLDCNLYAQEQRLILHIVNLSGSNPYPGYVEEYLPVGPISIAVKLTNFIPKRVLLRVAGTESKPEIASGWAKIELESLGQHELLVWE